MLDPTPCNEEKYIFILLCSYADLSPQMPRLWLTHFQYFANSNTYSASALCKRRSPTTFGCHLGLPSYQVALWNKWIRLTSLLWHVHHCLLSEEPLRHLVSFIASCIFSRVWQVLEWYRLFNFLALSSCIRWLSGRYSWLVQIENVQYNLDPND